MQQEDGEEDSSPEDAAPSSARRREPSLADTNEGTDAAAAAAAATAGQEGEGEASLPTPPVDPEAAGRFHNFYDLVDFIAVNYIFTADFQSLKRLTEKNYCDKMIVLTADILDRYYNDLEITYLEQRVKQGAEVNELAHDRVFYMNKDKFEALDVSNDKKKSLKKKRVCIGIAKFYIKIAHIFAAIVMTINPVYTYKDESGATQKTPLAQKDSIPRSTPRTLFKLNVCDNRIRALRRGMQEDADGEHVKLHPNICDLNDPDRVTVADEPGITELMELYFDDDYDYSTGKFRGMSEATKAAFRKDLELFYTTFTGQDRMPETIQKFSDIKLRDYKRSEACQSSNSILRASYKISKHDDLFVRYAENILRMIQNATQNQRKLLAVINLLFTYVIDPYTQKKVIRIHPELNETRLQQAVDTARKLIVELYVRCEKDYITGVKIYEAIVETKILQTTQSQITHLIHRADEMTNDIIVDSDAEEGEEEGDVVDALNPVQDAKETPSLSPPPPLPSPSPSPSPTPSPAAEEEELMEKSVDDTTTTTPSPIVDTPPPVPESSPAAANMEDVEDKEDTPFTSATTNHDFTLPSSAAVAEPSPSYRGAPLMDEEAVESVASAYNTADRDQLLREAFPSSPNKAIYNA